MPIGENAGGNMNVLVFEVVMVTRDARGGPRSVRTVGIHPLLVAPSEYQIIDTGRSSTTQTDAWLLTKARRGPLRFQMSGSFGVEQRGLAGYLGTGEQRYQRFRREVVRLPDATKRSEVDDAIELISGTPGLRRMLEEYDEQRSLFVVNYYDFWHGIACAVTVDSFNPRRMYRNGGASGLVHYALSLTEAGPLIEGTPSTALITGAMQGGATWASVNEALASYTVGEIAGALHAPVAVLVSQLASTLASVREQAESARALFGGASFPRRIAGQGGASFLSASRRLADEAEQLADVFRSERRQDDAGGHDVGAYDRTRQSDPDGAHEGLARFEALAELEDLEDLALWQTRAGLLLGMDVDTYQAVIASEGEGRLTGDANGSNVYTVADTDNVDTLERRFGVSFERILAANRLAPDEALLPGTRLQVPQHRPRQPGSIAGLQTYGSHMGEAALGSDIAAEMHAVGGRLVLVDGVDCLVQGQELLIEEMIPVLQADMQRIPPGQRTAYLALRLGRALAQDPRISSVEHVEAVESSAGGYEVSIASTAINGVTVRTGGSA